MAKTPATMPDDEDILMPGGTGPDIAAPAADDPSAARVAALEAQLAQAQALVAQLSAQAQALATVPSAPAAIAEPRIIGMDWRTKTSAEAKAAGITQTVLCSDGYYVPG